MESSTFIFTIVAVVSYAVDNDVGVVQRPARYDEFYHLIQDLVQEHVTQQ